MLEAPVGLALFGPDMRFRWVNAALTREPELAAAARAGGLSGWVRYAAGAGLAAGVAAAAILWLRFQAPGAEPSAVPLASTAGPAALSAAANAVSPPDSFVVPPVSRQQPMMIPPTQLADYVVAHSAYSWPISGGSLLSSLMVSEAAASPPAAPRRRVVRALASHGHGTSRPH